MIKDLFMMYSCFLITTIALFKPDLQFVSNNVYPAKICLEHVEVCMIITMVVSVEDETVVVHYC